MTTMEDIKKTAQRAYGVCIPCDREDIDDMFENRDVEWYGQA